MTALAAYEAGLAGADCWLRLEDGRCRPLPVARWAAGLDEHDQALVGATLEGLADVGAVLDVGCGPGRLTAAIQKAGEQQGIRSLGVDISPVAVRLATLRGASAVRADVLAGPLPLHPAWPRHTWPKHWDRVLLADGNLGIGGDPLRLLGRARSLLAPGGRIVADLREGAGIVRGSARIESVGPAGTAIGGWLPWAWVGAGAAAGLGEAAGLQVRLTRRTARRWIVVWERP